jgi:P-type E1-E2 ATPase
MVEEQNHSCPAFKYIHNSENQEIIESKTTFLGFVCIKDPVKDNVKEAIEKAKNAGISVFMITGDNGNTALAIGKELGLVKQDLSHENKDLKVLFSGDDLPLKDSENQEGRMSQLDL